MKYTFESTEAETLAYIGVFERTLGRVIDMVGARLADTTSPSITADESENKHRVKYGEVQIKHKPTPAEFSAALHSDTPAANPYADMDFSNYTDMPDEYKKIKPPIWIPDTNGHGVAEFDKLVHEWSVNLGVEGADQPDRPTLMRECANHPKVLAMLGHVAETGGLAHAVALYVNDTAKLADFTAEEKARVNLIATTMCQVSSILFPDLAQMYEHRDIFKERK